MQFSEMIEMVIRTTKRPDKRQDIKDAINAAISYFTLRASFRDDYIEGEVNIDSTAYAQSFSIAATFTRFRRLDYLKRPGQKGYINYVDPKNIFTPNACEQLDTWYRAGDNIVFKMRATAATLDYGYFQYPTRLSADEDTHWMMTVSPDMIHRKACAEIFDIVGEPQDSARYERKAMELFDALREDREIGASARAQ